MDEDVYKSPESDVAVDNKQPAPLPNVFVVAAIIILVSLAIGAVLGLIEFIAGFTMPANTFLSAVLPAFIVGMYYGKKRQGCFPRNFRLKVTFIWLLIGLVITWFALRYFIGPDVLSLMAGTSTFIAIFIGLVLMGTLVTYFTLLFGEKLGAKSQPGEK